MMTPDQSGLLARLLVTLCALDATAASVRVGRSLFRSTAHATSAFVCLTDPIGSRAGCDNVPRDDVLRDDIFAHSSNDEFVRKVSESLIIVASQGNAFNAAANGAFGRAPSALERNGQVQPFSTTTPGGTGALNGAGALESPQPAAASPIIFRSSPVRPSERNGSLTDAILGKEEKKTQNKASPAKAGEHESRRKGPASGRSAAEKGKRSTRAQGTDVTRRAAAGRAAGETSQATAEPIAQEIAKHSYWLLKEASDKYPWEKLKHDVVTKWDGVRSHPARANLCNMHPDDFGLFYQMKARNETGIVGVFRVASEPYYPDPTDQESACVDIAFVADLPKPMRLRDLKALARRPEGAPIAEMPLMQNNARISVQPVPANAFSFITSGTAQQLIEEERKP